MRTRAMTEPSAGLMDASSPPEGLGIQSPSHAPELTGSISNRSKTSFAVAVIVDLRKPAKSVGAGGELPDGCRSLLPHPFNYRRLKGGVVPFRETLGAADAHARIARGGAALLHRAHVKRIADDIAVRGVQRQADERFRIARQQRRQRGVYRDARGAQAAHGLEAARWTGERSRVLWNHGGSADETQRLPGVVSVPAPASRYFAPVLDAVVAQMPGAR